MTSQSGTTNAHSDFKGARSQRPRSYFGGDLTYDRGKDLNWSQGRRPVSMIEDDDGRSRMYDANMNGYTNTKDPATHGTVGHRSLSGDADSGDRSYFARLSSEEKAKHVNSASSDQVRNAVRGDPEAPYNSFRKLSVSGNDSNTNDVRKAARQMYAEFSYSPQKKSVERYTPPISSSEGLAPRRRDHDIRVIPKTSPSNSVSQLKGLFDTQTSTERVVPQTRPSRHSQSEINYQRQNSGGQPAKEGLPSKETDESESDDSILHSQDGLALRKARFEQAEALFKRERKLPPPPIKLEDLIKKDQPHEDESRSQPTSPGRHGPAVPPKPLSKRGSGGLEKGAEIAVQQIKSGDSEESGTKSKEEKGGANESSEENAAVVADGEVRPRFGSRGMERKESDPINVLSYLVDNEKHKDNVSSNWQSSDVNKPMERRRSSSGGARENVDLHNLRRKMPPRRASSVEFQGLEESVEVYGKTQIDINAILGLSAPAAKIEEEDNSVFNNTHKDTTEKDTIATVDVKPKAHPKECQIDAVATVEESLPSVQKNKPVRTTTGDVKENMPSGESDVILHPKEVKVVHPVQETAAPYVEDVGTNRNRRIARDKSNRSSIEKKKQFLLGTDAKNDQLEQEYDSSVRSPVSEDIQKNVKDADVMLISQEPGVDFEQLDVLVTELPTQELANENTKPAAEEIVEEILSPSAIPQVEQAAFDFTALERADVDLETKFKDFDKVLLQEIKATEKEAESSRDCAQVHHNGVESNSLDSNIHADRLQCNSGGEETSTEQHDIGGNLELGGKFEKMNVDLVVSMGVHENVPLLELETDSKAEIAVVGATTSVIDEKSDDHLVHSSEVDVGLVDGRMSPVVMTDEEMFGQLDSQGGQVHNVDHHSDTSSEPSHKGHVEGQLPLDEVGVKRRLESQSSAEESHVYGEEDTSTEEADGTEEDAVVDDEVPEEDEEEVYHHHEVIELPPPPERSCLSTNRVKKKKRNVVIHDTPSSVIFTYGPTEYDRGNAEIDPVTASAEWELEKRVEKMDVFSVDLDKDSRGLGLSIIGLGVGTESGVEKLGIFVKSLTEGGAAQKDGRIQVKDQILEVNDVSLVGVTQQFAARTLKDTYGTVRFLMGRDKNPRHYNFDPTLEDTRNKFKELEQRHNEELNDLLIKLQESDERAAYAEQTLEDVKLELCKAEERAHNLESDLEEVQTELTFVKTSSFPPAAKMKNEIKKHKPQDTKKSEKIDQLQKVLQDITEKLSASEQRLVQLQEENSQKQGDLSSVKDQLEETQRQCQHLVTENARLNKTLQDKEAYLNQSEAVHKNQFVQHSELVKQHSELLKQLDVYKDRSQKLELDLNDKTKKLLAAEELTINIKGFQEREKEHISEIKKLKMENGRLSTTLDDREDMLRKLAEERMQLEKQIKELDQGEKQLQNIHSDCAKKEQDYRDHIRQLEEKLKGIGSLPKENVAAVEATVQSDQPVEDIITVNEEISVESKPDLAQIVDIEEEVAVSEVRPVEATPFSEPLETEKMTVEAPVALSLEAEKLNEPNSDETDGTKPAESSTPDTPSGEIEVVVKVPTDCSTDVTMIDTEEGDSAVAQPEMEHHGRTVDGDHGGLVEFQYKPGGPFFPDLSDMPESKVDSSSDSDSDDGERGKKADDDKEKKADESDKGKESDDDKGSDSDDDDKGSGSHDDERKESDDDKRKESDGDERKESDDDKRKESDDDKSKEAQVLAQTADSMKKVIEGEVLVKENSEGLVQSVPDNIQPAPVTAESQTTKTVPTEDTPSSKEADRSSFLDSLRENPSFRAWLDEEWNVINEKAKEEEAERIAQNVIETSPVATSGSGDEVDAGAIVRSGSTKLDESYFHRTVVVQESVDERPVLLSENSVDQGENGGDEPAKPIFFDIPETALLDTSTNIDKLKIAQKRPHRRPSSPKLALSGLNLDDLPEKEDESDEEDTSSEGIVKLDAERKEKKIASVQPMQANQLLFKELAAAAASRPAHREDPAPPVQEKQQTAPAEVQVDVKREPSPSAAEPHHDHKSKGERGHKILGIQLPKISFGGKPKRRKSQELLDHDVPAVEVTVEDTSKTKQTAEDRVPVARSTEDNHDLDESIVPFGTKERLDVEHTDSVSTDEAVVPFSEKLDAGSGEKSRLLDSKALSDVALSSGPSSQASSGAVSPVDRRSRNLDLGSTESLDGASGGDETELQDKSFSTLQWMQRPVNEWDARQVGLLIIGMGMDEYVDTFQQKGVNGPELLTLNGTRLKELGVTNSDHRAAIKKKIKELKTLEKEKLKAKDAKDHKKEGKSKDGRLSKTFWKGKYTLS